MKTCIACGMPMEKDGDFAMGDRNKDYCAYCARPDGTLKSYEEMVEHTVPWAMKEYNISEEEARKQVPQYLKTLPAWKDR